MTWSRKWALVQSIKGIMEKLLFQNLLGINHTQDYIKAVVSFRLYCILHFYLNRLVSMSYSSRMMDVIGQQPSRMVERFMGSNPERL